MEPPLDIVSSNLVQLNYPTYYATVIVNLLGSFSLGLVLPMNIPTYIAFLAIGILGAFTTF
ncbi:Fluoride-specific ion channel FluC OS=Ureibacillus acetophenoni OX=614649 GN=fluC PE=3 SV=1 [Ureibacillus acetophenoni]